MLVCLYEILTSQAIDKNISSAVTKRQEPYIKLKSKLVNSLKKLLANRGLVVLTLDLQTTQE